MRLAQIKRRSQTLDGAAIAFITQLRFKHHATSQECSACHHLAQANRDGEKFICEDCGHIDHADTQASRTILRRANFKFVTKDVKKLPADCGKVTLVRHDSAIRGKRDQGKNRTSKVIPEKRILFEQLSLQLFD
ncbi:zinc ribbon domain-containing protein [aff. Roholtiella sp. LEGE 12411]|uniref:zinc ribbon domain-containing protein n=1 Tax=aff. Roholtiella sp. LEGE 12411 TaxID=1828822 RepID=UPI00187F5302|nr:zinc ribbon domain-containing protein [aff. Roholtiella sp. LEGE 12411]MBE9036040.1 transposase [aff. Roholtiella sp. LEGE 12411]